MNAALGLARSLLEGTEGPTGLSEAIANIQGELFALGADFALAPAGGAGHIRSGRIEALKRSTDRFKKGLPALSRFILPGGCPAGAALHLARAVCRRAERTLVTLAETHPVHPDGLLYLNRLSEHLFVLARTVNWKRKRPEIPWKNA